MTTLLEINNLYVQTNNKNPHTILDGIDFKVYSGETVGIVGESGSGKSMTALSVMGLLPEPAIKYGSGEVKFNDKDLTKLTDKDMNKIRGKDISMIFQEPMTSLNPSFTIGNQLAEVFKNHTSFSREEIRERSEELLARVNIPEAKKQLNVFPHELSGGMRQRVMIAMALACQPKILLADEPTTALDVTVQSQILELLVDLQSSSGMTIVIITHDLGVVAETCDRVIVMYAGQIVEEGSVQDIFTSPKHPYTQGLLRSIPKLGEKNKGKLYTIKGVVPDIGNMPKGCRFNTRCEFATDKCKEQEPPIVGNGSGGSVKCWFPL